MDDPRQPDAQRDHAVLADRGDPAVAGDGTTEPAPLPVGCPAQQGHRHEDRASRRRAAGCGAGLRAGGAPSPPTPSTTTPGSVGVGAAYGPSYDGSDDYVIFPAPCCRARSAVSASSPAGRAGARLHSRPGRRHRSLDLGPSPGCVRQPGEADRGSRRREPRRARRRDRGRRQRRRRLPASAQSVRSA